MSLASPPRPDPVDSDASGKRAPKAASLRVSFAWTLAGTIVYTFSQWVMLMAVAKLGTAEMVGQFAYALAVTAPVIVLTSMNLRVVQATDAANEFSFASYLGLRLVGTVTALAVIVAIAAGNSSSAVALSVLAVGVAKGIEAVSDIYFGSLQRLERMDVVARSMIIKGVTSVAAFALAVSVTRSVAWAGVALALAWAAVLLAYDIPQARSAMRREYGAPRSSAPSFQRGPLLRMARMAFPLAIVMFLLSLNGNIPRYFLEHDLGVHAVGIYAAIMYVVVAITTVHNALGQALIPRLAKVYAVRDLRAFARLIGVLAGAGVVLGGGASAVVAVAGRRLLVILYRAEYADAHRVLLAAALVSILALLSSALGYALTAMRSFRPQAPLWIFVTAVTGASCWVLVPHHGLLGAVAAGGIAAVAQIGGQVPLVLLQLRRHREETC